MKEQTNQIPINIHLAAERYGTGWMCTSVLFFATNNLLLGALGKEGAVSGWVMVFYRSVIGMLIVWALFFRSKHLDLLEMVKNPLLIVRGVLGGIGIPIFYITIVELGAGTCHDLKLYLPLVCNCDRSTCFERAGYLETAFRHWSCLCRCCVNYGWNWRLEHY